VSAAVLPTSLPPLHTQLALSLGTLTDMKYLLLQNHTNQRLIFIFCTISQCTCDICQEWISVETAPFADRDGSTYGRIEVGPYGNRIDRFCSKWDCVGDCFFAYIPGQISVASMFDYDESRSYTVNNGQATVDFCHRENLKAEDVADFGDAFEIGWEIGSFVTTSAIYGGCTIP
jgi:hypothetical protein